MRKQTILVLISLLITTFFWAVLNLDHLRRKTDWPVISKSELTELAPAIDLKAFDLLKKK